MINPIKNAMPDQRNLFLGPNVAGTSRVRKAVTMLCLTLGLAFGIYIGWLLLSLPSADLKGGLEIFDRNGKTICLALNREKLVEPVKIKDVCNPLKLALVSAEDRRYFEHAGVDLQGLMRAIVVNLTSGEARQGGSTITQQAVKNFLFDDADRNFNQKLSEILLSLALELKYSKAEILETYLNSIYFGRRAYGVQRASREYFNKKASDLDLGQSTLLAALINAPSFLSASENFESLKRRQRLILEQMLEDKQITESELKMAMKAVLPETRSQAPVYQPYVDQVLDLLESRNNIVANGRKYYAVHTGMSPIAQNLASINLNKAIKYAPAGIDEAAVVSINIMDGTILSMVGGAGDYSKNQFNRAMAPHTAGSAFKPFVYLAAINLGILKYDSLILDAPLRSASIHCDSYNPRNFDGNYLGWVTVRRALSLSRNTCAIRVLNATTAEKVAEVAHAAGITAKLPLTPSLALGTCAVSPLELASAFGTICREGKYKEPRFITRLHDRAGRDIPLNPFDSSSRSALSAQKSPKIEIGAGLDAESCKQLTNLLEDVVERGTAKRARLFDRPVAGKTGTSDGNRDLWFVGYTPDMVTAVWMGNDENKAVSGLNLSGGTTAAQAWSNYMRNYYAAEKIPVTKFGSPTQAFLDDPEPLHLFPKPSKIFSKVERILDLIFGDSDEVELKPHLEKNSGIRQADAADLKLESKQNHSQMLRKLLKNLNRVL